MIGTSRNRLVCIVLVGLVIGMLALSFAFVPMYDWFCRTTGFGGKPIVASSLPDKVGSREFKVVFDANVLGELPWKFKPAVRSVLVKSGEVITVNYTVENLSDLDTAGIASYSVTPESVAGYFNKVACFCFVVQKLAGRSQLSLPVTFFVDPDIELDLDNKFVNEMSLSYTFYQSSDQLTSGEFNVVKEE